MNRRTFVQLGGGLVAATALPACDLLVPDPTDPTDPTTDPGTTTTDPGTTTTTPGTTPTNPDPTGWLDGNVLRDYQTVSGVEVPVAWRSPRGDVYLGLDGGVLAGGLL